jgi:hypothetical protein
MDQVALDQLAARASAAGFSSIAEYAAHLEKTLLEIRDRDWVENALDPHWPAVRADEAVSEGFA